MRITQGRTQTTANAIAFHRIAGLFCYGEAEATPLGIHIPVTQFRLKGESSVVKARAFGNGEKVLSLCQPWRRLRTSFEG